MGMFNARPGRYIYNERNDNRPPVAHAPGNAEQELIACAQQQSKRQSLTRYLSGREKIPSALARFPTGPMPSVWTSNVPITRSCARFPLPLRQQTIPRRRRCGRSVPTQLLRRPPSTTRWQRQPCENVSTYRLPFPWPPGVSPCTGRFEFNGRNRSNADRQCRPCAQLRLRPRL